MLTRNVLIGIFTYCKKNLIQQLSVATFVLTLSGSNEEESRF